MIRIRELTFFIGNGFSTGLKETDLLAGIKR